MSSHEDLTGENLSRDPYPVYARLRREAPVALFEGTHEYFVTRHADCMTVGMHERIFVPSDSRLRPEARVFGMPNVLSMRGPEHLALRQGIDQELQARRVDTYVEALCRPVVTRYLDELQHQGCADLTAELFEPISVRVIGDLIGLGEVPNATLQSWFHAINAGLQNTVANDPKVWSACDAAIADIDAVMRPIYERVLGQPDHSLFSHVVHGGREQGAPREFTHVMPTMRVIILGGLQEPGHGAANATYGLLQNAGQNRAVQVDPAAWAQRAFDEGLRWIAPIGVTPRVAGEDFTLEGTRIPAGASVAIVLASANRDEARYESADAFDMNRPRNKGHSAFGFRPHFCPGHYLSRCIGRMALEEAYRRLPNLRLDTAEEVQIRGWRFRGVLRLPVRWDP